MIFTDTHTHLYASEFDADRNELMQQAIDAETGGGAAPAATQ